MNAFGSYAGGAPDRNDWLRTCAAQGQLYPLLTQAGELLEELI